jgi:hypothetical protein
VKHIVDGVEIEMTPEEVATWEAEQAAYVPPEQLTVSDDQLIDAAMREEFIERMAANKTAPAKLKEAALRLKAKK